MRVKACLAIVLLLAFVAVATPQAQAFFWATNEVENRFIVGQTVIEVHEVPVAGGILGRSFVVENVGSATAYVRLCTALEAVHQLGNYRVQGTSWSEIAQDGYCYYQEELAPGQRTKPLSIVPNPEFVAKTPEVNSDSLEEALATCWVYAEAAGIEAADTAESAFQSFVLKDPS